MLGFGMEIALVKCLGLHHEALINESDVVGVKNALIPWGKCFAFAVYEFIRQPFSRY